jgi:acyl-CoA thioester hydrolase
LSSAVFTYSFKVAESAIDDLNHVNNLTYLQWCLEAAEKHWITLSDLDLRANFAWVVLRHEIDYRGAAMLGDELQIETWVNWSRGAKSERAYRIVDKKNARKLVEAKTTWCLIDRSSGKPVKIPGDILNLFHNTSADEEDSST